MLLQDLKYREGREEEQFESYAALIKERIIKLNDYLKKEERYTSQNKEDVVNLEVINFEDGYTNGLWELRTVY